MIYFAKNNALVYSQIFGIEFFNYNSSFEGLSVVLKVRKSHKKMIYLVLISFQNERKYLSKEFDRHFRLSFLEEIRSR